MTDGPPTKPRTPSSLQRIATWGLVEAWLAQESDRAVVLTAGPHGLRLTVIASWGEAIEDPGTHEDPSRAALRAIDRLGSRRKVL